MDSYRVLGLPTTATQEEIKQAYRKLVKLYHPDINKSPEAPQRFKEIQKAYEYLKNMDEEHSTIYKYPPRPYQQPIIVKYNIYGSGINNFGFTDYGNYYTMHIKYNKYEEAAKKHGK